MKTEKYMRKSFAVDAIRVTEENIEDIAEWCQGEVRTQAHPSGTEQKYIHVRVMKPMNPRQSMAFVGDWVLYAGTGYKVYTNNAFLKCFEEVFSLREEKERMDAMYDKTLDKLKTHSGVFIAEGLRIGG